MKRVTVRYYNIIRDLAGRQEQDLEVPDECTVSQILDILAEQHAPPMRRLLITKAGVRSPYLSLFLNDVRVAATDAATPLADGDVLMLLPAIAGGG